MFKSKKSNGFTLIELMVVIVIIGILVAIALPNFLAAQDRAKISSTKANMHTFQTIVEIYAVDWGGVYPENTTILKTEADTNKHYWKVIKNPYSSAVDDGITLTSSPILTANSFTPSVSKGGIAYLSDTSNHTSYSIYGAEKEDNIPIKTRGVIFFLSNS